MTLAEHLSISPFALLDWYESGEIQSKLERYHNLERQLLELRSFQSKRRTIESLEHIIETTDDLIEMRRTATALHRVIRGIGGTNLRGVRDPGGTDQGSTDLRDVNRRVNPTLRDKRAATTQSATTTKHPSPRSTPPAEPRSASDKKLHRAGDHGTPDPHARSTAHETRAPSLQSEPILSKPLLSDPLLSEPGSASDLGDDKPADRHAEQIQRATKRTPKSRSDQNKSEARPPFGESASTTSPRHDTHSPAPTPHQRE